MLSYEYVSVVATLRNRRTYDELKITTATAYLRTDDEDEGEDEKSPGSRT